MERTVRKIAVPGKIAQWGAKSRLSLASNRSRPQVGMSGGKPRPRNESVDSAMIAAATSMVPATMTGPIEFGRMWRTTWRSGGAPDRERDAAAVEYAREEVLAEVVRAERVRPRGGPELGLEIDLVDRHAPNEGARDDADDHDGEDRGADRREPVAEEAAAGLTPERRRRLGRGEPGHRRDPAAFRSRHSLRGHRYEIRGSSQP